MNFADKDCPAMHFKTFMSELYWTICSDFIFSPCSWV
uniref:Uncharacterized protein n=1 Tax=Rhizophora mucronata TaxID=61149 RepID=A0A2P2NUE7_RHIMU